MDYRAAALPRMRRPLGDAEEQDPEARYSGDRQGPGVRGAQALYTVPVSPGRSLAVAGRAGAPRQLYGYDLIAWVGLARYHRHRQRREMRTDLARRGNQPSDCSVSQRCDRLLQALEALHWQRTPALRAAMAHGYPLHIDSTSDRAKGGLCCAWTSGAAGC